MLNHKYAETTQKRVWPEPYSFLRKEGRMKKIIYIQTPEGSC